MAPLISRGGISISGSASGSGTDGLGVVAQPARSSAAASTLRRSIFMGLPYALNVVCDELQHLVGGLDGLGVGLEGALGLDHVDQLLGDIDVGSLQRPLMDAPQAFQTGRADQRRAAGRGLLVEVLAYRLQPGRIDEIRQLNDADLGAGRLSRQL